LAATGIAVETADIVETGLSFHLPLFESQPISCPAPPMLGGLAISPSSTVTYGTGSTPSSPTPISVSAWLIPPQLMTDGALLLPRRNRVGPILTSRCRSRLQRRSLRPLVYSYSHEEEQDDDLHSKAKAVEDAAVEVPGSRFGCWWIVIVHKRNGRQVTSAGL
ncbi:hypothetical protein KCU62_g250, partial [Aureobasidium sp. EXF-3399]